MTKKQITWNVSDGRRAIVTVRVAPALMRNGDIRTDGAVAIEVIATLADAAVGYDVQPLTVPVRGAVARAGKLGLRDEQYQEYLVARAECEDDPDYQAYQTRVAQAEAEALAYRQSRAAIAAAMAE